MADYEQVCNAQYSIHPTFPICELLFTYTPIVDS